MMRLLLLVTYFASSNALDEAFMKGSASDGLLLKSVKASASLDQLLQCAHHCLLQEEMCQGFQMQNTTSATCQLFEKICFKDSGHEVYFARSDPIQFNLALGKPASQSSTYQGYVASFGNDGIYPKTNAGFFHTNCDFGNWWRVDIQSATCITAVYFMNRGHAPNPVVWQRTKNIVVTVSLLEDDIMDTGDNRCGYIDGAAEEFDNLVACGHPILGRYVQLQMLYADCFHLCEVEVHGH